MTLDGAERDLDGLHVLELRVLVLADDTLGRVHLRQQRRMLALALELVGTRLPLLDLDALVLHLALEQLLGPLGGLLLRGLVIALPGEQGHRLVRLARGRRQELKPF